MRDSIQHISNCNICEGTGRLAMPGTNPPAYRMCRCAMSREINGYLNRGMSGLSKAPRIESSPLTNLTEDDLWVTGNREWFLANMRHVAMKEGLKWHFKVCTDANLITAWLATAALKGSQILDPDALEEATQHSLTYMTLPDLVDPPDLLIIKVGVKNARNVAMGEVLVEALQHREHTGKPTWVWDDPVTPFASGMVSYSYEANEIIQGWKRVKADSHIQVVERTKIVDSKGMDQMLTTTSHTGIEQRVTWSPRDAFLGTQGGKKR